MTSTSLPLHAVELALDDARGARHARDVVEVRRHRRARRRIRCLRASGHRAALPHDCGNCPDPSHPPLLFGRPLAGGGTYYRSSRSRPAGGARAPARRRAGCVRRPRRRVHGAQRVADPEHALARPVGVVAVRLELDRDVDDPARVDDEVGRPQDPARGELARDVVGRELVVRGADDRAAAQLGHRVVVEDAAQRARRDDVDVGAQRGVGLEPRRRPARRRARGWPARRRRRRARAGGGEPRASVAADVAEADHRDATAREVPRAPEALGRDADAGLDAERRPRARVAGAAALQRQPGDVVGALGDHRHVGVRGADVLRGHVAPADLGDAVAEVEQRVAAASPARAPARRRAA